MYECHHAIDLIGEFDLEDEKKKKCDESIRKWTYDFYLDHAHKEQRRRKKKKLVKYDLQCSFLSINHRNKKEILFSRA